MFTILTDYGKVYSIIKIGIIYSCQEYPKEIKAYSA